MTVSIKQTILGRISDSVSNFMYYDRKEDEELSAGDLEKAIDSGVITIDEIVQAFARELKSYLDI